MTESFKFSKYHGAGNDFIIADANDLGAIDLTESQIALWCHRRYGIGADGFMLYVGSTDSDKAFTMRYFNADGKEGTMCGNGGRCMARYAFEQRGFHHLCTLNLVKTFIGQKYTLWIAFPSL